MLKRLNQKGILIIEILIVVSIISIALVSILDLAAFSLKTSTLIKETTKAKNIAEETIEAVRNFRDNINWYNDDFVDQYDGLGKITTGVAYHLEKSIDTPPKWMLIQGERTVQGFLQKVVFENVSRDPITKNIEGTYNPANNDPETEKVTATVSWKDKKVELVTYFTNWKE